MSVLKTPICIGRWDSQAQIQTLGSPWLLIFDTKTIKKPLWKCLPLGAILFSIFSGFRCHLGRQHNTQDLTKTPQHSSGGHTRAAQELCHTAHKPCKTAFNTRPERSRPPRTSQTSKMTPKSRWGTPPSLNFGANMDAFGPSYSATL